MSQSTQRQLELALAERRPLLELVSADEASALVVLDQVAAHAFPESPQLTTWTSSRGFQPPLAQGTLEGELAPALVALLADETRRGLVALLGPTPELGGPRVTRLLRDAYLAWRAELPRALVVVDAAPDLAPELGAPRIELGAPGLEELTEATRRCAAGLEPELQADLAGALQGLSLAEAEHVLHGLAADPGRPRAELLGAAFAAKSRIVAGTGALEFVPPVWSLDGIGGLERLKDWLTRRTRFFTPAAAAEGLPVPRGILLMGVSGCGKSFAAKAISSLWGAPLIRLDMNLLFSGLHGSPEAVFHRVLACLEAIAPCVLWIDEIENGLGVGSSTGEPRHERLFSGFLTWLQEKPPLVFVAATANRIELLPPELLRKGRFDQVFFCDLPDADERRQILEIHIRAQGGDPADFRLEYLVVETKGWSGAELAEAVVSARQEALLEDRPLGERDLARSVHDMVPLSRTMHEKIRALREWAHGRAVPASATQGEVT